MRQILRAFSFVLLAVCVAAGGPAMAQEKPRTLLELFFPGANKPAKAKPAAKPSKPKARPSKAKKRAPAKQIGSKSGAASSASQAATASEAAAPRPAALTDTPPAVPEKQPTAKKILVIGDFLAAGTAAGLTATFEQSPDVTVIDAANGSSGLVRDDFYNWPAEVATLITTHQPAVIVAMMGANDRQELMVAGRREEVLSPAWQAEYRARVGALARAVTSRNIPLVWVGQVPFRSNSMTADMLPLNDIFRQTTDQEKVGSAFVDVWEGFVDETGKFIERGPDVNGQTVALRTGQVNVTKAGYRKIAFYTERTLNRFLGNRLPGSAVSPQINNDNTALPPLDPEMPLNGTRLENMPPIDLLDTTANGGDTLLGATVQPAPKQPVAVTPAPEGRIDNLKLKP